MKTVIVQHILVGIIISIMSCSSQQYKMLPPSNNCTRLLKNLAHLLREPDSNGIYSINWEMIDTTQISPAFYTSKDNDSIMASVGYFNTLSEKELKSYFGVYKQFDFFRECIFKNSDYEKKDVIKYLGKPTFVLTHYNDIIYKFDYSRFPNCPNLEATLLENQYANCSFVRFSFDNNELIKFLTVGIYCCSEDITE